MATRKIPKKADGGRYKLAGPRFNQVLLIDDSDVDSFSFETLLNEISLSRKIIREISPISAIEKLKKTVRLSDVPELIFIDLNMKKMDGFEFLDEFSRLSDFVRDKCKIVVVSSLDQKEFKTRVLLHPNVIRFLVKPLDVVQLKDFVTSA
jgi:response regulator RpfG family c-di-GMP phosphodiesterase